MAMRLLKARVEGVKLFRSGVFEIGFYASDRVINSGGAGGLAGVHHIGSRGSIYSQNVTAVAGVNASGKTTALQLVRFVLSLLSGAYIARGQAGEMAPIPSKLERNFSTEITFALGGKILLLRTEMTQRSETTVSDQGRDTGDSFFVITDEELWEYQGIPSKGVLASSADFRNGARLIARRNGDEEDGPVLNADQRAYLRDDMSIVSAYLDNNAVVAEVARKTLQRRGIPGAILHVFDSSIEYLRWDDDAGVYHLKFAGEEERVVGERAITSLVSSGTIVGSELVQRALVALQEGSYLIVDEIEQSLNKELVAVVIGLFVSASTNPRGAQLVFSTHYLEVLDTVRRKDNIYLTIRGGDHHTDLVKYSDKVRRIENKKSEVLFSNIIGGTAPKYADITALKSYVAGELHV